MTAPRTLVSIPPFTDAATVVAIAVDAEEAGWDGVFLWDHLQWEPTYQPPVHDPWVLLGAIAERTERVRIGTLVTPLTRRRLQVVARHVLTLDHLSNGRMTFAVGLGEPAAEDFAHFGDESDPRVRGRMLDEGLEVLDGLLRGDVVDHDGDHYTVKAQLRPGPVQSPRPPIWVAGVVPNQRPLQRARRWDGVAPIASGDELHARGARGLPRRRRAGGLGRRLALGTGVHAVRVRRCGRDLAGRVRVAHRRLGRGVSRPRAGWPGGVAPRRPSDRVDDRLAALVVLRLGDQALVEE